MVNPDTARGGIGRSKLSVVRNGMRPPQDPDASRAQPRRRPRPTPHLTPDEYVRLLAFIEDGGGIVTIDEISRAMPRVTHPVSAVFDLCDKGVLTVDWEAAFDGEMRVWRVGHASRRIGGPTQSDPDLPGRTTAR